jgi:imidazolonepropionase-like amidohydrolase
MPFHRNKLLFALAALMAPGVSFGQTSTVPPAGLRENRPSVHALVGARVVVAPGKVLEKTNVVVRNGVIVAVDEAPPPADARVWDVTGKTLYAGFIDAYSEMPFDESVRAPAGGAPYWNRHVTPQFDLAVHYAPNVAANKTLRSQGLVARLVAPVGGVMKGTSALVATGDGGGGLARRVDGSPRTCR